MGEQKNTIGADTGMDNYTVIVVNESPPPATVTGYESAFNNSH